VKRKLDKIKKQAPAVKAELAKQIPRFSLLEGPPAHGEDFSRQPIVPPDKVLKSLDTSFESFFYKRQYSERNFSFYMQVCAQQYKPDLAQKAFDRMTTLGIKPTDHSYTQLQLAYAKNRNLEKVLEL